MDSATLVSLMKMGAKVQKLLEVKSKIASTVKSGLGGRGAQPSAPAQTSATQNGQPLGATFSASGENESEKGL